jgi:hypothetical protein
VSIYRWQLVFNEPDLRLCLVGKPWERVVGSLYSTRAATQENL